MSRNQLLAIVGVVFVLGVALQRSPEPQPSRSVPCVLCPGPLVQIISGFWAMPGAGSARGGESTLPSRQSDLSDLGRAGWFATPEPLLPSVPTAKPEHIQQHRDGKCLDC